jgi:hypothetical protein
MDETPLVKNGKYERGIVKVGDEVVGYSILTIDARSDDRLKENQSKAGLSGRLNIFVPGHGQRVTTAKKLLTGIVTMSKEKLLWSINIDPTTGGEPVKAKALIKIIKNLVNGVTCVSHKNNFDKLEGVKVTIFGWSHGGGEVLTAAGIEPELFDEVITFCPTGLVERRPVELLWSFTLECIRILFDALRSFDSTISDAIAVGFDIIYGLLMDILRVRSLRCMANDYRCACKKVVGEEYQYNGIVLILFAKNDTVIRWKDVCPERNKSEITCKYNNRYIENDFPYVSNLSIKILDGNHLSPESNSDLYVSCAYDLLKDDER